MADDYRAIEEMLEKLEYGHLHVAAFGRVSVGKSATLNALLGERRFSTSPLHGETRRSAMSAWREYDAGGVFVIDTPGINEIEGEDRERMAHEVAERADLVLFVVDSDLTQTEISALRVLASAQRPILLVLNKVDRYTAEEKELLMASIEQHSVGLVDPRNIVAVSADPPEQVVILVDDHGGETETVRRQPANISALKERLWDIVEAEGMTH